MSEQSSKGAPGPGPRRPSRSALILICSAVVSVATIAAAVLLAVQPAPQQLEYGRLPEPCAMLSPATLATYLPNPTGTPESLPAGGRNYQEVACKWSSHVGGEDRTLVAQVVAFRSSSAIIAARQAYNGSLSVVGCHCKGVTVSARPVAGLGDQATAVFLSASPAAGEIAVPGAGVPGVTLLVLSRNAEIAISYSITAAAGTPLGPSAGAAPVTEMIPVARGILATLARPAAVSAAPVSAEPHYAGRRDPCRLITAATLAAYAPGAAVLPISGPNASGSPSPQASSCSWSSDRASIFLTLSVFPDSVSALQGFQTDAQTSSTSVTGAHGVTVSGSQWLADLGEAAAAIFQTKAGTFGVDLLVWSGNAELNYWYSAGSGSSPTDRASLLAGGIALARDGLASLANPGASSYPQRPLYASPDHPCTLVKASTLATYAPGAATIQSPGSLTSGAGGQLSDCAWTATNGSLVLIITIYADLDSAQGGFAFQVQYAHQNQNGFTFNGAQPVKGVGDQATAVFETANGSPSVTLYVLSANAAIEMGFTDVQFGPPPLSRAAKLAADIAIVRDVLSDLRRT